MVELLNQKLLFSLVTVVHLYPFIFILFNTKYHKTMQKVDKEMLVSEILDLLNSNTGKS